MFKIRSEQLAAFESGSRRDLHEDIYQRLRESFCCEIAELDRTEVLNRMMDWHERGVSFGLNTERAIGRFLGLQLTVCPDFDEQEDVRDFLVGSDMTGDQKMTALFCRLRASG